MKYKAESRPLLCLINLRNTAQKLLPYGRISISSLEIYIHSIEIEILTLPVDKWVYCRKLFHTNGQVKCPGGSLPEHKGGKPWIIGKIRVLLSAINENHYGTKQEPD